MKPFLVSLFNLREVAPVQQERGNNTEMSAVRTDNVKKR